MKCNSKVPGVTIYDCGLIVNPHDLGLLAVVMFLTCVMGSSNAIEIKCPFSEKDMTIKEACPVKNLFMKLNDGMPKLKRNHDFFFQCFGVMASFQLAIFGFVVYIQKDVFVEKNNFFYLFLANSCRK